jgi:hypothetical protein
MLRINGTSSLLTAGRDNIENGWLSGDPTNSARERWQ